MKRVVRWIAIATVLGAPAGASNLLFHVPVGLEYIPGYGGFFEWLQLPHRYFPDGTLRTPQHAGDLCTALNGAPGSDVNVSTVIRWDTRWDIPVFRHCRATAAIRGFELVPGEAYIVKPSRPGVTIYLAGAEEVGFARNKGGVRNLPLDIGPTSSNFVSLPYNIRAERTREVCVMFNGGYSRRNVARIVTLFVSGQYPRFRQCVNSNMPGDPPLELGKGVVIVPSTPGIGLRFDVN